jgi:hypothetical protein
MVVLRYTGEGRVLQQLYEEFTDLPEYTPGTILAMTE